MGNMRESRVPLSAVIEPPTQIFVFTDNLTVHRSLREAAAYHEFRETIRAYDEQGRVFELPPSIGAEPVPLPGNSRAELINKLRREVLDLAVRRPDLLSMSKREVEHAPDEEIIQQAVRWFSIPEPSSRSVAIGSLVTVMLFPILTVLFVLCCAAGLSGLAADGAKRAFGAARRRG
jgi:hypothetical protein